jgi:bifunctional aspartokinase / homoserine dehydrogenase 1
MATYTMKFGGTSVGTPEAIAAVADIVKATLDDGHRVVVVVSAMGGVTDMLLRSMDAARRGDKWEYQSLNDKIRHKHEEVANLLLDPNPRREKLLNAVTRLLDDHLQLCQAVNILGEYTPRILDSVVSFGERMSSRLVAAVLQERGIEAQQVDATQLIVTDDNHQSATPLWERTREEIARHLIPALSDGKTPVITGFIGATVNGTITTLGRGGSDYSAAILAANSHSNELVIWTDVDGVMTTDPRIDPRARVLPAVSYAEVGELAFYGAKVLHPKTVQPIVELGMSVRVRNTFNPQHPGTVITAHSAPAATVIKAVTVVHNVSLMTVGGRGMLGVPGIAARAFGATARAGASILMISQSSSEQSFCFTVPDDTADGVKASIEDELAAEIRNRDVDHVDLERDAVIVTAVGVGMRGTPGVAGRVFTQMGELGVNVLSIAQGSSECSISFIVHEDDAQRAVMGLHDLALDAVGAHA